MSMNGNFTRRDLIKKEFANMVDSIQRKADRKNLPLDKEIFIEIIYEYFSSVIQDEVRKVVESFILDSRADRYDLIFKVKDIYDSPMVELCRSIACGDKSISSMFISEIIEKSPTEVAQRNMWSKALVEFQNDINATLDNVKSKVKFRSNLVAIREYNIFDLKKANLISDDECMMYVPSEIKFVLVKEDDDEF